MINDPDTSHEQPHSDAFPPKRESRYDQGVAQILVTSVLVVIAFAAGWFGNAYVNSNNYVSSGNERLITQAWSDITNHYVITSAIDQQKMAYAAINAMVATLGDTGHSRFDTPAQAKQEQQQLQNAPTVGIGVYLSGGGSQPLRIDAVIPNSPAAKGNVKPGDEIVGVDGKSVRGQTIDQVRPLITGKAGTDVTLTLIRPSQSTTATFDVTLTRASFTAPTVVSYIIPGQNIEFIQITQFAQDADSSLKPILKDAQAKHVKGIILDLRGNPGGYLDQAVSVASEFIPAGHGHTVLIEKSRTGETPQDVQPGGLATTTPLTVLVDNGTASAAEIVAGAISVNRPDVETIGQTTFGTGTVLEPFTLADGSVLWLGTQEWLLPNGQSIYHKGYTPKLQVALPQTATPVSPLVAQEEHLTLQQIQSSGDAQLLRAIQVLGG